MLAAVHGARALGWVELPPLTLKRWLAMAPMSIAYGLHAALVLRALAALNVPMYNTLKRTTPMMVLVCKAAYILLTEYLPPPCPEPLAPPSAAHSAITMQPLGASASLAMSSVEHRHVGAHEIGVGHDKGLGSKGEPGDLDDHDDKRAQHGALSPFWLQLRHALASMANAVQNMPLTRIRCFSFAHRRWPAW
ncbi:hypothetical protein DUNSADRAFT_2277 [Dunaliella salina]|uniref:Encoded protein n=1 Tax=Dunaliella salina TaxID=3046 RepID=A0ABQ7GVT9_DUNSA|nr:hypothetical protein DUNSADRAFT_2277 [Dunaliella salina]|eukprot:KAF5838733.1 hypothetical protein DUNSADRAFT_2277 [Dunaliella salina]